jgi:uncharacterized protein YcfL
MRNFASIMMCILIAVVIAAVAGPVALQAGNKPAVVAAASQTPDQRVAVNLLEVRMSNGFWVVLANEYHDEVAVTLRNNDQKPHEVIYSVKMYDQSGRQVVFAGQLIESESVVASIEANGSVTIPWSYDFPNQDGGTFKLSYVFWFKDSPKVKATAVRFVQRIKYASSGN